MNSTRNSSRAPSKSSSSERTNRRRPVPQLGPLSIYLVHALRRAHAAVANDLERSLASLNLRPAECGLLLLIHHQHGLKQADASAALGMQTPNFVALVDGLERRDLLERARAVNDRRSHSLQLTKAGEVCVKALLTLQSEHEERMAAKIGKVSRDQLMSLLEQLGES